MDPDFDNERDGLIGGEPTSACSAGEGGYCPDFGPCVEIGDRLSGEGYEYLGHFRQKQYAREGHNDMSLTEPGLPPLDMPSANAGIPQQRQGGVGPVGSAINKGITGLIGGLFGL